MEEAVEINLRLPVPVFEALKDYIKKGDGWEVSMTDEFVKKYGDSDNRIDMTISGLIKYLMSTDIDKQTELTDVVNDMMKQDKVDHRYFVIRSRHPALVYSSHREYILLNALIYEGIPIPGYFDGMYIVSDMNYRNTLVDRERSIENDD